MTQPISIKDFDLAIQDSPHKGVSLMRCVEIDSFPGAVKANKAPSSIFPTTFSQTFTADASTDTCTIVNTNVPTTGTAVTVSSTGTLPAGLSSSTVYFIIRTSTSTFKLATSIANAQASTAVDITDAGTGTHTCATLTVGSINHIIKDPRTGNRFLQDSNGRVWYYAGSEARLLIGNTLTNAAGNGLAILRCSDTSAVYLFAFRNAAIDVVNVLGTTQLESPSWSNSWKSLNSGAGTGNRHKALYAQDAIIYFTDDRYVGSIRENSGSVFDPASAGTYTYNNQALDAPIGEVLVDLEEQGVNLLAAGSTWNKIYPWDRVSDSYNLPLNVPENQVFRLKNIGGLVYILAGRTGNVYRTQGTYVTHFKKIPDYLTNNSGTLTSTPITWGGIDAVNGNLIFGMAVQTSGNSGVYMLYPDGRLVIDNLPSTGSANALSFEVTDNFYYFGYSGGADAMSTSRYASFEGVVHSALYRVATKVEKGQLSEIQLTLAKPASTGHCRIKYRTDTSSAFADFPNGAVSFTADGTNVTFNSDIGLIDIELLQIQLEIDGVMEIVEVLLTP